MRTNEEILNEIHSVKNHKKTTQHIYKHSINKYCELNKLSFSRINRRSRKRRRTGYTMETSYIKKKIIKFSQVFDG